jgi:hypothetical protein
VSVLDANDITDTPLTAGTTNSTVSELQSNFSAVPRDVINTTNKTTIAEMPKRSQYRFFTRSRIETRLCRL